MSTIKSFEDLEAWQKARTLTRDVYKITQNQPWNTDFGLKNQTQRASVSIMANIAEGFGYKSDKQFLRYLDIARASVCEVQSLLYVALDAEYLDQANFDRMYEQTDSVIALVAGLQRYLRSQES